MTVTPRAALTFRPHPTQRHLFTAAGARADYALAEEDWSWRLTITPYDGITRTAVTAPCREIGERMAHLTERALERGPVTRRDLLEIRRAAIERENAEVRLAEGKVPYLVR